MYYSEMNAGIKSKLELEAFSVLRNNFSYKKKANIKSTALGDKLYQKLIVLSLSLLILLFSPELPRELEALCQSHNSNHMCNVW